MWRRDFRHITTASRDTRGVAADGRRNVTYGDAVGGTAAATDSARSGAEAVW